MPALRWLSRLGVKQLVIHALGSVGSITDFLDIEAITFKDWTGHHKRMFAVTLVDALLRKGYDVQLTEEKLDRFANVGELIEHVTEEHSIRLQKLSDAF